MCGIAGFLQFKAATVDPDVLHAMIGTLAHRGPDGAGIHADGEIGLAHARLSIIDIAGGSQPMFNEDGSIALIFNGEIFNYIELRDSLIQRGISFRTRSDTEVLLRLYEAEGEECVQALNGQWAFAIWDARTRKLFLSRDRLGVRPLFYTVTADSLLFASEIKALFATGQVERCLDLETLDQIFTFWVPLPSRTAFKGVYQLAPGHSMVVQDGRIDIRRYWAASYEPVAEDASPADTARLSDELLWLLQDATRIRLRSDVPVGAYLSGGIDSSLIAALVKGIAGKRLQTFSIGFEDTDLDESPYQQAASAHLGTDHAQVQCSHEEIARTFPEVLWHAEQPILRTAPAPLYLLSKLVRDEGFKVVLTGEGADEILGGYDIFKEAKIRRFWAKRPDSQLRPLLLRRLYPYLQQVQRQPDAYLKNFFAVFEADLQSPFYSHLPRWRLAAQLKLFFSDEVRAELSAYEACAELGRELPSVYREWPSLCQSEYLETAYLLPGYILSSQGDRMSMAHSVEGRYPFLDHRVVDFASRLPVNLKMNVLREKYLLRRAARPLLPAEIVRRTKQPYRAPDGKSFFCSRSYDYVEDLLSPQNLRQAGIFRPEAVTMLTKKFKAGRAIGAKDNMALVGILSTQLLFEQFIRSFQPQQRRLCTASSRTCAVSW